jgi:AraC-like DNA-binding protein/PAS domain-containing protein
VIVLFVIGCWVAIGKEYSSPVRTQRDFALPGIYRLGEMGSADLNFGITVAKIPEPLVASLFSQLAEPFTGEHLFDRLPDLVFFIKNERGEYVVVNQTLVERCGRKEKRELIGRRADAVFPAPFGKSYRAQDEKVLARGEPIFGQLELHFYPDGTCGWCLTHKLPLKNHQGLTAGLVGTSKDLQRPHTRSEDYSRIAGAVERIRSHYQEKLRVSVLAAAAGLSLYQFEERIRAAFQITAGQLIQQTRMDAAVQRLRETDLPISSVALDCGYSDQSAFTRQFKKTTGLTPAEYRKGVRLQNVRNTSSDSRK